MSVKLLGKASLRYHKNAKDSQKQFEWFANSVSHRPALTAKIQPVACNRADASDQVVSDSHSPGRLGLVDGLPYWQALHSESDHYEIQVDTLVASGRQWLPGQGLVAAAALLARHRRMPDWRLELSSGC